MLFGDDKIQLGGNVFCQGLLIPLGCQDHKQIHVAEFIDVSPSHGAEKDDGFGVVIVQNGLLQVFNLNTKFFKQGALFLHAWLLRFRNGNMISGSA